MFIHFHFAHRSTQTNNSNKTNTVSLCKVHQIHRMSEYAIPNKSSGHDDGVYICWCDRLKYDAIMKLLLLWVQTECNGTWCSWLHKCGCEFGLWRIFVNFYVTERIPWCFRGITVCCILNRTHTAHGRVSIWKSSKNRMNGTFPGPLNLLVKCTRKTNPHERTSLLWRNDVTTRQQNKTKQNIRYVEFVSDRQHGFSRITYKLCVFFKYSRGLNWN